MRVLLVQLDGDWPNHALGRIAQHHRERADEVDFLFAPGRAALERGIWDRWDRVYGSLIFEKTRPLAERLAAIYPDAILGGTGWDFEEGRQVRRTTLETRGIQTERMDYSLWPSFTASLGFTQRGCRLSCPFCVVPKTEGKVRENATIADIWRGEPWPRHVALLDNDFFGQPRWRDRIDELKAGRFRVCFTQGVNVREIGEEEAAALASVDYRDGRFAERRLYCAWDNAKDGERVLAGLERLARAGVKPDHVMVYMLVGFWCGEPARLVASDFERVARLRVFGARPYPMPYRRTPELVGFQRWVVGSHDKRIGWDEWRAARFQPRGVHRRREAEAMPLFGGEA